MQVSIRAQNGNAVTLPLKLQLVTDRLGNPALMAYPVRAILETERNKALSLAEQEAERLKKGEIIQKAVDVDDEKIRHMVRPCRSGCRRGTAPPA